MTELWQCRKCNAEIDHKDIDWWGIPFCRDCGEWIRQRYIADMEREIAEGEQQDD